MGERAYLLGAVVLMAGGALFGAAVQGALEGSGGWSELPAVLPVDGNGAAETISVATTTLTAPPESGPHLGAALPGASTELSAELALAVEHDLFRPEREPPAERYRLPGERPEVVDEVRGDAPRFPAIRVHGTASSGAVGLALVRVEDRDADDEGPPTVLALGESIAGYSLVGVTAEGATLQGPAGSLTVAVTPLPSARADEDRDLRIAYYEQATYDMSLMRSVQDAGARAGLGGGNGRLPFVFQDDDGNVQVGSTTFRVNVGRGGGGG